MRNHSPFLWFLGLLTLAFHVGNFYGGRFVRAPDQPALLKFKLGERTWLKLPTLVYQFGPPTDDATMAAGRFAQSIKRILGEGSTTLVHSTSLALDRTYGRADLRFFRELRIPETHQWNTEKIANEIRRRGAELLILPVPAKITVEVPLLPTLASLSPNPWHRDLASSPLGDGSRFYQTLVNLEPRYFLDLYPDLSRTNFSDGKFYFRADDPHWSEGGIELAVAAIKRRVVAFKDQPLERILLAGTSFSTIYREQSKDLGSRLESSLGVPVTNLSFEGAGTLGSLRRIRERKLQLGAGDLVVWEYPVQEIFTERGELSARLPEDFHF